MLTDADFPSSEGSRFKFLRQTFWEIRQDFNPEVSVTASEHKGTDVPGAESIAGTQTI